MTCKKDNKQQTSHKWKKRKTLELREVLIAIQQVAMVSSFNFLSQVWFWRVVLFCLSSFPDLKSLFFTLLWLANKLSWSLGSRMANSIRGGQSRSLSLKPHGWVVKKRWKLAGNFQLSVLEEERKPSRTQSETIYSSCVGFRFVRRLKVALGNSLNTRTKLTRLLLSYYDWSRKRS